MITTDVLNLPSGLSQVDTTTVTVQQRQALALQVRKLVQVHNARFPNQMYERTILELTEIMNEGRAVVFADADSCLAYFGMIAPQFSDKETQLLKYQLVELGNSITSPDFRRLGLATEGTVARIEMALELYGENTILYCTTENPGVQRSYNGVNQRSGGRWTLEPVNFNRYAYFAGRTCSYSERGLDDSHVCSLRRRCSARSTSKELAAIGTDVESRNCAMDCTLVLSDSTKADDFQTQCLTWHQRLLPDTPLGNITDADLTRNDVLNVAAFYDHLRVVTARHSRTNGVTT